MNRQQLIEDNMNLVYFVLNKYYPMFVGDEDLVQCGMVGLCRAADTWEEDKSAFSTYASKCILNEIYDEFKRRCRLKDVWSLDYQITDGEGGSTTTGDMTVGDEDVDFVDEEAFYKKLRPYEKLIVDYKRTGYTSREIAEKTGLHPESVRNILRRLRYLWRFTNGD